MDEQETPAELPLQGPSGPAQESIPQDAPSTEQLETPQGVAPQEAGQESIQQPGEVDPLTQAVANPNTSLESVNAIGSAEDNESVQRETEAKARGQEAHSRYQGILDDIEQKKQAEMVPVLQQYQETMEQHVRDFQSQIQTQAFKYREVVEDLQNYNPNPWSDKGTGYTVGRAIAIGLNQMGIAFNQGQGSNVALKMLDDGLNRDLMNQRLILDQKKDAVESQGMLLNQMRQIYKDDETAALAAKSAGLQLVAARAQMQLMSKKPELRSLQDQQFLATIQAQAEVADRKVHDATVKNAIAIGKARQLKTEADARLSFQKSIAQDKMPTGLFSELGQKLSPKERDRVETLYSAVRGEVAPGYKELLKALNGPPSDENRRRFEQASKQLIFAIKKVQGEGARMPQGLIDLDKQYATGGQSYLTSLFASKQGRNLALQGFHDIMQQANEEIHTRTGRDLNYWSQRDNQMRAEELKLYGDQGADAAAASGDDQ